MREFVATNINMVIETATIADTIPVDIDKAQPEIQILSQTRRPLPQIRCRIRYRGERIMLSVNRGTYQVMATNVDVLPFGHRRVAAIFYRNRISSSTPRRFTNLHAQLHVATGYFIRIGILRDAISGRKCPGLAIKQCKQPRSPVSHILYVQCAQSGGAKGGREITIIVEKHHVMVIGICGLNFVRYIGATRRLLARSGAMVGPHDAVNHCEAFWPAIGARDSPEIAATMAYMAANTVDE